ncbi:cytochrome b561 and DOMON domain-containing protein At5g47530 [Diospyros lotus]|uniref:cytochrome b561 and DOMON domain-containing protein At5g47530 n=1 Tax=Diospyros lotus TaxID=55363 RepID=UPI002258F7CC|nr:cytochrome b561 and DOMON domain-containing protein At5g47530 [Diospyros lotus]
MATMCRFVLLCSTFLSVFFLTSAQSCVNYAFKNNKQFSACNDLPYLNSFLHWTYNPSSETLQIAFRHAGITSSRWVAWAINPQSKGMLGSQAIVAFQKSDGTMSVYTSPVTAYQTNLQQGDLSFPVSDLSATFSDNEIVIFATLQLPNNSSTVNQVWQDGPVSNGSPQTHDTSGANVQSMASLNLLSGQSAPAGGGGAGSSKIKKKNIHGVLNAVSWGIMMPLGGMMARYLKVFKSCDPAWFYLHATCQTSGYIIGVAGWATGLRLGADSPGVQHTAHRAIGILLFCLATLQVTALLVRPKREHNYRLFWNVYHRSIGYAVIILSVINIFKGFHILNPVEKWERAYVGIVVALGLIAAFLEVYTWIVVMKRKNLAGGEKIPPAPGMINGRNYNGLNGVGARTQNGL